MRLKNSQFSPMIPHHISVDSTVCTTGEILSLKVGGLFVIGDKVIFSSTVMFIYIFLGFVVCFFFSYSFTAHFF